MKGVRVVGAGLAGWAAWGVMLGGASPAAAAPEPSMSVSCQPGFGEPTIIVRNLVLAPGEVLAVETSGCNYTGYGSSLVGVHQFVGGWGPETVTPPTSGNVVPLEVGSTVVYTAPDVEVPGSFQFSVTNYRGSNLYGDVYQFFITVCSGGQCPVVPEVPSWVQSFQRADASSACPEGWSASWEQWPGGGRGGFVCTRSVPAYGGS